MRLFFLRNPQKPVVQREHNERHPLLQTTVEKCIATFLTIQEMQSLGFTCKNQREKMLGKGWIPTPEQPQSTAILPSMVRTRYSENNCMSGQDFQTYAKVYSRSLPEIHTLNLLGMPELCGKLQLILAKTPNLKSLQFEGADKETQTRVLSHDLRYFERPSTDFKLVTFNDEYSWVKITDLSFFCLTKHTLQSLQIKHCLLLNGSCLDFLEKDLLTILHIERCIRFGDKGMQIIPQFPLRTLTLAFCPSITSIGWACLAQLPQLEHLDVSGCDQLTDEDLLYFTQLPLRTLNLRRCTKITHNGLNVLEGLNLTSLILADGTEKLSSRGVKRSHSER